MKRGRGRMACQYLRAGLGQDAGRHRSGTHGQDLKGQLASRTWGRTKKEMDQTALVQKVPQGPWGDTNSLKSRPRRSMSPPTLSPTKALKAGRDWPVASSKPYGGKGGEDWPPPPQTCPLTETVVVFGCSWL